MATLGSRLARPRLLWALIPVMLLTACSASIGVRTSAGPEGAGGQSTAPAAEPASSSAPVASTQSDCPPVTTNGSQAPRLEPDPIGLATTNQLAELPVAGLAPRSIDGVIDYPTPESYLSTGQVGDAEARYAAMNRDGFRGGTNVAYSSGPDSYGVIILQFADAKAAADYLAVHLRYLCSSAAVVRQLDGVTGVSYLRTDNLAKAVFVVGDTEVQVDICSCVEVRDRLALAGRWAVDIQAQLASRPDSPSSSASQTN